MSDKKLIGDLLRAHGLKKTPIRLEMLELFMDHDFALSASDIVAKMTAGHDRVTIYRALSSFEENGILHRASEDGQGVKYALCGQHCPDESHSDEHAHFVCDECHHTYCLEDVKIPEVKVSNEFMVDRANYTLSGICKECKS
ncbi:transcriptional repressor [Fulvivirga sp. RKSG066]|uniref:Fur family transcriptional regulator n=1 Tax=Fulvivirga aurantia TaxID=2529383 RepID=UPI0012BC5330|nr:transcriptional repressor [Fulvivirga aurantia]MTI22863.1 transcriptional repressor [Fulvivirga aurantia]